MQPGLTAKQIKKLAKPTSDKELAEGANLYLNDEVWSNGFLLLYEAPPEKVRKVVDGRMAEKGYSYGTGYCHSAPGTTKLTPEQLTQMEQEFAAKSTVQVWPVELIVRETSKALILSDGADLRVIVNPHMLSSMLKRADCDKDEIIFHSGPDNAPLIVQNGHRLGALMPLNGEQPEWQERTNPVVATFKYAGELPKPSHSKLDRFRNAHEDYWYVVQDGDPTPEIMIIEDNWTEEKCVYGGPVDGSRAARQWMDL